ncbi:MAG: hypothetical protein H6873_06405 [Hyphomicrobiaceae bacterium]|nr:hypothetical protein [Hyphomicrobiaceae bacterium]
MFTGPDNQGSRVHIFDQERLARLKGANDNGAGARSADEVRTVTMRRTLEKSGVEVKVKVPVTEFTGVAVSTRISEEGVLTSAIHLIHPDADFNYLVFEETGNDNVVAEWQNWGRKLRLPLFIRAGDGQLMPYSQQVDGVLLGETRARRKTQTEANRRPRFLNRRNLGDATLLG